MTLLYWLAAALGITVGLRCYRAVRRYLGPLPLDAESPYGSVGDARFRQIQRTGR